MILTWRPLSHRGRHIRSRGDQDFDNDTDANDPWIDMVYDDSWRIAATFRSGDAANRPRERFVYHCAGMNGRGSSSYIDDVILRERSDSVGWTDSPATTLGERLYYLQNWRHDVVATLPQSGAIVERTTYTSYGVPRTFTGGDFDRSGFVDNDDFALLAQAFNTFVGDWPTEFSHRDQDPLAGHVRGRLHDLGSNSFCNLAPNPAPNFLSMVDAHADRGSGAVRVRSRDLVDASPRVKTPRTNHARTDHAQTSHARPVLPAFIPPSARPSPAIPRVGVRLQAPRPEACTDRACCTPVR